MAGMFLNKYTSVTNHHPQNIIVAYAGHCHALLHFFFVDQGDGQASDLVRSKVR